MARFALVFRSWLESRVRQGRYVIGSLLLLYLVFWLRLYNGAAQVKPSVEVPLTLRLTVVVCGAHVPRALVAVKSAVMMSRRRLHVHIFSNSNETFLELAQVLTGWPDVRRGRVTFSTHTLYYPPGEDVNMWISLFRKCATVRLFLSDALDKAVDSTLYIDSDVIFLSPVEHIWSLFKRFNASQIASMTPEHEATRVGWYNRFGKHPYYGKTGLNSGVMLLNLTRIRSRMYLLHDGKVHNWSDTMVFLQHKFKSAITWGDQDILNILFAIAPHRLFVHNCEYNFRPDHCMFRPLGACPATEQNGTIHLLHSNRNAAQVDRWGPAFKTISKLFSEQDGRSLLRGDTALVTQLTGRLGKLPPAKACGRLGGVLVEALSKGIAMLPQ